MLCSWDAWVPQDRVRKFSGENKELAAQLHAQMKALQQRSAPAPARSAVRKGTRANGSDFSSARGSEERHLSTTAQSGRVPRRNRDYDLENVSAIFSFRLFHALFSIFPRLAGRLLGKRFNTRRVWSFHFALSSYLNLTSNQFTFTSTTHFCHALHHIK